MTFGFRGHRALAALIAFSLLLVASFSPPAALAGDKSHRGSTIPGIDVLAQRGFDSLKGKKVGLITNHTGITRDNRSTIDVMFEQKDFKLTTLFSPEHGIRGTADEKVASSVDEATKLPIYSLYGKTQKPTPEMLSDVDVLVFDIQDIGTRFYTYIGTMAMAMQAAKEQGRKFIVLDRPNTIGGEKVEGFIPPVELTGKNTCIYPIPTRHGMTIGELALLFNDHFKIGCDLEVVKMKNWDRSMYFDETGLLWLNPSPNMRTMNGAILYPGLGASETTSIAVGRGTDRPFEMYGAPYMDGLKLAMNLNGRNIPGIRFVPFQFTPTALYHKFKDEKCFGVFAIITDRDALNSVQAGLHMVQAMHECFPDKFTAEGGYKVETGSVDTWDDLTTRKMTPEEVIKKNQPAVDEFLKVRKKYLLY
ncbi:DUF1343 domain-containing protein [Candidatus Sumerlaeota bacterium]|nr:DUF1343 domain-containing protein [Candidatus Sumerlaeota bacterium]